MILKSALPCSVRSFRSTFKHYIDFYSDSCIMQQRGVLPPTVVLLALFFAPSFSHLLSLKRNLRICNSEQEASCKPGTCEMASSSVPEAYSCACPTMYAIDRQFKPGLKEPLRIACKPYGENPCHKCHPGNTQFCSRLSRTTAHCECYPEFSSNSMCHREKNGCNEMPLGATQTGNQACRVDRGNVCLANPGTDGYICVCLWPNQRSNSHFFENCLGKPEDPCDNFLCVGFGPVETENAKITPRLTTT